jgi:uncharacterized protein (TIGR02147 family)
MESMEEHLKNLFMERCRANEQYSLRAFAKSIGVAPSTLSELLNGKRSLTKKLRDRIGLSLNMAPEQIAAFSAKQHGNSNQVNKGLDEAYNSLALDAFYLVSQWYHYGILQLMKTKNFQSDPQYISKRLGISEDETKTAIERLLRIGILERRGSDLVDVTNGQTTHLRENHTDAQLRDFQAKALQIAMDKLHSVPIELRDNTSMTLAMSKSSLAFAKKEITKFRRTLTKKLEQFDEADEVYQLAIALSPLTIVEDSEKKGDSKNEIL